jgi:hypothetical protein
LEAPRYYSYETALAALRDLEAKKKGTKGLRMNGF